MTAAVERSGDDTPTKVTTRVPGDLARAMRISAARQGVSIEAAYSEAVEAYLRRVFKKLSVPAFWISGFEAV